MPSAGIKSARGLCRCRAVRPDCADAPARPQQEQPAAQLPGRARLVQAAVLPNRRHVLTQDAADQVLRPTNPGSSQPLLVGGKLTNMRMQRTNLTMHVKTCRATSDDVLCAGASVGRDHCQRGCCIRCRRLHSQAARFVPPRQRAIVVHLRHQLRFAAYFRAGSHTLTWARPAGLLQADTCCMPAFCMGQQQPRRSLPGSACHRTGPRGVYNGQCVTDGTPSGLSCCTQGFWL